MCTSSVKASAVLQEESVRAGSEYLVLKVQLQLVLWLLLALQAAAIPETWLTAFQLLHQLAGVKKGEWVLIHAAGSGVGLAAVQVGPRS